MAKSFEEMVSGVIQREGGSKITRDPDDPGGTTKYGIAQRSHPDVDVENLTYEQAVDIYKKKYWVQAKVEKLPVTIQEIYFDMVVNAGYRRGVKILQEAANAKGANLVIDGKLGPMTLKAVKNVEPDRLRAYRALYYAQLCTKKPILFKYYYGWFRRTIEV